MSYPPHGKKWDDLQPIGSCLICHVAMFTWEKESRRIRQETCGAKDCEHPDDICDDPKCYEARRKYYLGNRKRTYPCKFPRLRDKVMDP